ncbi:hypothetical protein [Isoptericola sp. NPDC057191]|uniref:hypothetical protein n=1 Tax=Isoptericola sp. NPDC057191 TaxID=3346041 RepID=UPI003625F23C
MIAVFLGFVGVAFGIAYAAIHPHRKTARGKRAMGLGGSGLLVVVPLTLWLGDDAEILALLIGFFLAAAVGLLLPPLWNPRTTPPTGHTDGSLT